MEYCYVNFLAKFIKQACALAVLGAVFLVQAQENASTTIPVFYYDKPDQMLSILKTKLQEQALNFNFKLQSFEAQKQSARQLAQIRSHLEKDKKSVVILNPVDQGGTDGVLHALRRAQTPVVFFNRRPPNSLLNTLPISFYVGSSPEEAGRLQAEILIDHLAVHPWLDKNQDGKLSLIMLKGEFDNEDTDLRTVSFLGKMRSSNLKLEFLLVKNADWSQAKAYEIVKKYLDSHGDKEVEAIVANNDSMALGAMKAFRELGLIKKGPDLPILGIDGVEEMQEAIKKEECLGTVICDYEVMAQTILDLASKINQQQVKEKMPLKERIIMIPYRKYQA